MASTAETSERSRKIRDAQQANFDATWKRKGAISLRCSATEPLIIRCTLESAGPDFPSISEDFSFTGNMSLPSINRCWPLFGEEEEDFPSHILFNWTCYKIGSFEMRSMYDFAVAWLIGVHQKIQNEAESEDDTKKEDMELWTSIRYTCSFLDFLKAKNLGSVQTLKDEYISCSSWNGPLGRSSEEVVISFLTRAAPKYLEKYWLKCWPRDSENLTKDKRMQQIKFISSKVKRFSKQYDEKLDADAKKMKEQQKSTPLKTAAGDKHGGAYKERERTVGPSKHRDPKTTNPSHDDKKSQKTHKRTDRKSKDEDGEIGRKHHSNTGKRTGGSPSTA